MGRLRRGKYGVTKKKQDKGKLNLKEEYSSLYTTLKEGGATEKEIQKELKQYHKFKTSLEHDRPEAEADDKSRHISLRVQYPLEDIKKYTSWDSMTEDEKDTLLWGIGYNTKKYHYYIEHRQLPYNGGEPKYGYVVYGQERLDKEWITARDKNGKRVASDEAILYDATHRGFDRDLTTMRGGSSTLWDITIAKEKEKKL